MYNYIWGKLLPLFSTVKTNCYTFFLICFRTVLFNVWKLTNIICSWTGVFNHSRKWPVLEVSGILIQILFLNSSHDNAWLILRKGRTDSKWTRIIGPSPCSSLQLSRTLTFYKIKTRQESRILIRYQCTRSNPPIARHYQDA